MCVCYKKKKIFPVLYKGIKKIKNKKKFLSQKKKKKQKLDQRVLSFSKIIYIYVFLFPDGNNKMGI